MNGGKIICQRPYRRQQQYPHPAKRRQPRMYLSQIRMPHQEFRKHQGRQRAEHESRKPPELFNAGNIEADDKITINGSNVINHGTLSAHEFNFVNARILNKADLTSATDIDLNGSQLFNYGNISFDEADGEIETNNSTATAIVNHYEARISGHEIEGGLSVYNDGFIETSKFTNSSSDVLYNSCTGHRQKGIQVQKRDIKQRLHHCRPMPMKPTPNGCPYPK